MEFSRVVLTIVYGANLLPTLEIHIERVLVEAGE